VFIGHYATAFAAKCVAPSVSLGMLFLASQFIDLLFPLFLLFGWEHVRIDPGNTAVTPIDFYDYPFSHSLSAAVIWAIVLAGIYYRIRSSMRGAFVLAGLVITHWLFDLISHRPDLPLAVGIDYRAGFGLWNSWFMTFLIESALFVAGVLIYVRSTKAVDSIGKYGLWSFVLVLSAIYIANMFGPPPPNTQAIAVVGLAQLLFIAWAYWVSAHRTSALR
jgi:hypothetical protein